MQIRIMKLMMPIAVITILSSIGFAQTSTFNYQGRLTEAGNPANGAYQMQFKLFDSLAAGTQIGSTIIDLPVTVTQGVFSVKLDFGANALNGANRWLEIAVRPVGSEFYTTLSPREQIASSPYAVRTLSAGTADNALALGGIPANEFVTNSSVGSSFIRNQSTLQTANFNINGSGAVGGSFGIGTATPGYKLDVNGVVRAFNTTSNDFLVQTLGGTNAWARFSMQTPSQIWAIGTSQNFNNNQFYLFDTSNQQVRMTVNPAGGAISFPTGHVGIGVSNPTAKLDMSGTGWGAVHRITDSVSGNSLVLQSGAGAEMKITGYNYNTSQAVPLNLSLDGALTNIGGSITQPRGQAGVPKAMVYVNGDGTMIRCYNGITGSTSGNCGFTSGRSTSGSGDFTVNFGFQVGDRFWSAAVEGGCCNADVAIHVNPSGPNALRVVTITNTQSLTDRPFMLIVY